MKFIDICDIKANRFDNLPITIGIFNSDAQELVTIDDQSIFLSDGVFKNCLLLPYLAHRGHQKRIKSGLLTWQIYGMSPSSTKEVTKLKITLSKPRRDIGQR